VRCALTRATRDGDSTKRWSRGGGGGEHRSREAARIEGSRASLKPPRATVARGWDSGCGVLEDAESRIKYAELVLSRWCDVDYAPLPYFELRDLKSRWTKPRESPRERELFLAVTPGYPRHTLPISGYHPSAAGRNAACV
jgi:hypothetical protein